MSIKNWPGGVITPTPVEPTGPYQNSRASGVWTLQQATDLIKQGNWPTAGNVDPSLFIENLFQTWLYTGNGSTQTINNGIDLAGKGGLVWIKARSAGQAPRLWDTARGINLTLDSTVTTGNNNETGSLTAFNSNGFSLGSAYSQNTSSTTYVSWTFRKQAKFFDVVTYTGDGVAGRTVAHNLGSVPGCIIVKKTNASGTNWVVYHRSLGSGSPGTEYLFLNDTGSVSTASAAWNNTTATATVFTVGSNTFVNANGDTYVAYLFAHDAGGFGASGSDNVISCGSFTGAGSTTPVAINLGWEPQWILAKQSSGTGGSWVIVDNMRGFTATTNGNVVLYPNSTTADDPGNYIPGQPTSTGMNGLWTSGETYIYIAIRRGPMKTPTTGTSVFAPVTFTGTTGGTEITSGFITDLVISDSRTGSTEPDWVDRLRGGSKYLASTTTAAEGTFGTGFSFDRMTGVRDTNYGGVAISAVDWCLRRAPGFFDVVCYTGTGVARTVTHNLGAVPEMMIVKVRSTTNNWAVYNATVGNNKYLSLDQNIAATTSSGAWNTTSPTSSVFTVGTNGDVNANTQTFVAYLFATCPGVSKVGSYTGTGNTLQIDCGFTGGARFVRIKRTDAAGDWYVWDSARGIVAGNDPYLLLNSTAAEVTTTDWVDTYSAGFELSNAGGNNANINTATYIFLAIA